MARGKLPIFERTSPDGRLLGYQVKVRKAGFPTVSRQFDKKADAERFAIDTLAQMERGTFVDRREAEATTLGEALGRYLTEITPAKKGATQERTMIGRWQCHPLAKRFLASLRGTDFAKYRDERAAAGVSPSTVRNELALISHLFRVVRTDWGMPVENPIATVRKPAAGRARDRRLDKSSDEEGRLYAACEESRSPYLSAVVRLAVETGMRQGEILALTWENVDFERKVARLDETKNDHLRRDRTAGRDVPLSPAAIAVLKAQLPDDKNLVRIRPLSGAIFPIGQMSIVHSFSRACARAGIAGLTFHDLRHEAASRLFERGLDSMEVASITGHKTLQMLKRYTHLRAEDLVKKLG